LKVIRRRPWEPGGFALRQAAKLPQPAGITRRTERSDEFKTKLGLGPLSASIDRLFDAIGR